ncbi:MAG: hypothetical protein JWM10_2879 [Myxococcaceae bacterium]|nr:hypothetical protein [Myxococcaceae bacterium]
METLSVATTVDPRLAPAEALHRRLQGFNRTRLRPETSTVAWESRLAEEHEFLLLEGRFVEQERARVAAAAARAPTDPDGFVRWFEALRETGPGQGDRLFPWLERSASREQMCWFLTQEVAGEAGFDDLVALTQVKLPTGAKLELARNYWDEMGQGNAGGMHGPMLELLVRDLRLPEHAEVVWESVALGNLMVALAANRRYAYQSIGALGVIELTAPGRSAHVNAGLRRLGVGGAARRYFALHATLDLKHSASWNQEVLRPLVAERPEAAACIAEGALLRLGAGARCFERYRRQLMV